MLRTHSLIGRVEDQESEMAEEVGHHGRYKHLLYLYHGMALSR